MTTREHIEMHSIAYDKTRNLYSDNSQSIKDSRDLVINILNIRFKNIYNTTGFAEHTFNGAGMIPHTHPHFEVHVMKNGNACLLFDDSSITIHDNDIIVISPNVYHDYEKSDISVTSSTLAFYAEKNKNAKGLDFYSIFLERINNNTGYLITHNSRIVEYIVLLGQYVRMKTTLHTDILKALFTLIYTELILTVFPELQGFDINFNALSELDLRMQTIQYYFIWHYAENITIKDLAISLKLSEKQTARIIKKLYGVDFRTHLSNIRLKNAKKLLRDNNYELQKIAEEVGFKSYNGFYLAFKKAFGVTPHQYRKSRQNAQNAAK